jgi:hypothetical protein
MKVAPVAADMIADAPASASSVTSMLKAAVARAKRAEVN